MFSCTENLFIHSTIFTDLPKFTERKIEKSMTSVKNGNSVYLLYSRKCDERSHFFQQISTSLFYFSIKLLKFHIRILATPIKNFAKK